ncbi:MAG: lysine--tRNA ligase [Chlamydiales bacterium]|nr:lysine--tRNA ligase [Chlamydiales bacterium]
MIEPPEYHSHEEFINRSKKLAEIRGIGIDPYPAKFLPQTTVDALLKKYADLLVGDSELAEQANTDCVLVAGRLVLFRAMGKNAFAQLQDENERIQVMFNREHTLVVGYSENKDCELTPLKFLEKKVDMGDFLGIEGHLFRTHKGELTIYAKKVTLLCKSLLPLPDKHSGLTDKELRYRKRWLDLLDHRDVSATFKKRSQIIRFIRDYFEEHEFLEVETPILQNIYGGAEAKPFISHINALDHQQVFLRISLEIPLKKLIVGGTRRVYEIGKVFRNEGLDKTHNPEFTMVEAYAAYWDYNDMMVFVETLFERIALYLFGTTEFSYPHPATGESILLNVKAPWKRLSMKEAILHYAKIDVDKLSTEELLTLLKNEGTIDPKKLKDAPRGTLISLLFAEKVEEHLIQPHHIIDHPIETTPLCKLHRNPKEREERIVERFESFILTNEICNAYTELNDPELQRELLVLQALKKEAGDEEANPIDEEFIEAICQGMPPTAGVGIGIDRLVMLFTGAISIRDVLYFPIMKPATHE